MSNNPHSIKNTNNAIQIYNITSQQNQVFVGSKYSNSDILNYKSWDVTDLPPLKRISSPRFLDLVKRLGNSRLR